MNALILALLSRLHCLHRRSRDALPCEKEARARAGMAPGHPELLTRGLSDKETEALAGIIVATHARELREAHGGEAP